MILRKVELLEMAIVLSNNIAQGGDRATTARRSVGLGLVEKLSWMRHWAELCPILVCTSPRGLLNLAPGSSENLQVPFAG